MKIWIITVAYHSRDTLPKFLEGLSSQTDKDFKTLVVNNSQDDQREIKNIVSKYEFAEFIQNDRNAGYAGGNNIGLAKAFPEGADWCLLLNPDTQVEPEFISQLKDELKGKKGLVGLPMHEPKGVVYGGKIQWLHAELSQNPFFPEDNFYIHGGGMLISEEVFKKIGSMDENYFLYFEDADYSLAARRAGFKLSYLKKPAVSHLLSASTGSLGSPTLLRYHYRNALYFNRKYAPDPIQVLAAFWSMFIVAKQVVKILVGKDRESSIAILKGVFDMYLEKMGKLPDPNIKRIGIECESIEGKNPMWGIGRIIVKLLEELSNRPDLGKEFKFVLYFKDHVPDLDCLKASIFDKKLTPVPFFPNRLFPFYYYFILPIKLWFEDLKLMFWPNYMLPIIAFGQSLVLLTEDVYYESHQGTLPLRYKLAYGIFGEWSAKFATRILAISETSKNELAELYNIDSRRIVVNHLGVDVGNAQEKKRDEKYILYVGQAFPRRHLKETIEAFEKISPEFEDLKLIAVGPDKYKTPIIENMVQNVNNRLGKRAVIHKNYVSDKKLLELYSGAKVLVYVSDREAFGLPPLEALTHGVPAVIADNALGRELFGDYAFYTETSDPEDIADAIKEALTNQKRIEEIKNKGLDFISKYTWKKFADRWLEIVRDLS